MSRAARRGPWLPEEDRALLHLVQTQGANNWVRISQQLQHRSPKQCRERYHQNLKPSLKHEPISAQEGEVIERLVTEMGKRWAEIARHLGNRSDNAVKNWWNGSMNRRRRNSSHATTGFKQMGPRLQPIPFSNVDRTNHSSQPYYTASETLPSGYDLTSHPPHSKSMLPLPPAAFPRASQQQQQQHWHHEQLSSGSRSQETQLHNSTISLPYPSFPKRALSRPDTSAMKPRLPSLENTSGIDANIPISMKSPVGSEVRRAPSLISDHLSTCSVSPKTITSPHPMISIPWALSSVPNDVSYQPLGRAKQMSPEAMADVTRIKDTRMYVSNLLE